MTEQLSDERLDEIASSKTRSPLSRQMARKLLELRAKLAAGPVMPETPADSVIIASMYALVDFDRDLPVAASEADYRAIRKRLMFLEHNPDDI